MGMFDYMRCKHHLPPGTPDLQWQTKDTPAQWMETYEIREDGSLWHHDHDIEDQSDPNAEGLLALAGCMTSVNFRWEPCLLTGEVRFYDSTDFGNKDAWWEFSAYFVKGQLKELHQVAGPVDAMVTKAT